MCGGIISETLVQNLATEGINLPPTIVQRAIDSYILHTEEGSVRIKTPSQEKRIGAVHRGSGPRDVKEIKWGSFDGYLQQISQKRGAQIIQSRIAKITTEDGYPIVHVRGSEPEKYDLLVVAAGVNAPLDRLLSEADITYRSPETTKTHLREYYLGMDRIEQHLGSAMHVFLLDIPKLEFAALIPKGDYVSMAMLGEDIDSNLVSSFLETRVTKECFPVGVDTSKFSCTCSPRINVRGAESPYRDRMVFIGDCGISRLYKDGIGAAYKTAKSAASTAVLQGISKEDFEEYYQPICDQIEQDNRLGKFVFNVTGIVQQISFTRRALLRMTAREQKSEDRERHMSTVLWDMFTGSASYREILMRTLLPAFWLQFIADIVWALFSRKKISAVD
jgi:flavin-dependent dehydrogenase